ncbi:HD domain-containing protein [Marispirochaeta sp.]|jgi:HD superfamily phosphodiesterase|uniref:HD domain-containing protein n=1 Tax=Marispirochaeta sp. TaxID=2038653 RepID=UPI0029C93F6F|nr:HD domain-containing protein [Marispirochaeta sp.]
MNYELSRRITAYFGRDAKRIHHAMQVYGFAETILLSENITGDEREIIETAALIHDIGIPEAERKHGSSAGNFQEAEGPPIARAILEELSYPPAIIDRVCFIVGKHHSYSKIDGIDFQILVEADLIVNIFGDAMSQKATDTLISKHFVTATGKEIAEGMYQGY